MRKQILAIFAAVMLALTFVAPASAETLEQSIAQLERIQKDDPSLRFIKVPAGPALDTVIALIAQPQYAGREIDADFAIVARTDKLQKNMVFFYKDGNLVVAGPISSQDYFTLLPTIAGI